MDDIVFRCLVVFSYGASLACSSTSPTSEIVDEADDLDSLDSTEAGDSSGSDESTGESDSTDDTGPDAGESETGQPPPDLPPLDPNENIPPPDVDGCPGIYAQDLLPTFELTVAPEVWEQMEWDWLNGQMLEDLEQEYHVERPLERFEYGDIVIEDATIRLRGNPTWWDADNKMQFEIDFNEVDPNGHFLGQRHLPLDSAPANRNMLRDRLSLWIMRDMGLVAPCSNHARVNVNGAYYGVFTNLEKIDKVFLERNFADPEGDLWKRAKWVLKTNETTANNGRLSLLKDADTIAELEQYLDLEQALPVYAAEAIIPNSDGLWAGGLNFYLYDEPIGGKFMLLPWDLDNTFDRFIGSADYPLNPDPVVWEKATSHGRPWYDLALDDPDWFDFYIAAIEEQFASSYDPEQLHALVDLWTEQIQDSVFEDVNKQFSNDIYVDEVQDLHDFIDSRAAFLEDWLQCWQDGGEPNSLGYCVLY